MAADNNGQKKTLRPIVAAISAMVIAFCAWSMSQYVNGHDPLAFLGSEALQTTVEEQVGQDDQGQAGAKAEDETASDDAKSDGTAEKKDAKKSSEKDSSRSESSEESSSKVETQAFDTVESTDVETQVTEVTNSASAQQPQSSSHEASSSSKEETAPAEQPQPAKSQTIVVTLQVDGGAGVSSAEIELEPGSTALDVLRSAGVGIETISNPFGSGTWVTSIGGLAEDSSHGWTYRVNGSLPGVMSDLYELSDGDTVLWQYV